MGEVRDWRRFWQSNRWGQGCAAKGRARKGMQAGAQEQALESAQESAEEGSLEEVRKGLKEGARGKVRQGEARSGQKGGRPLRRGGCSPRPQRKARYPLMNQLSNGQVARIAELAAVYRGDLLDPFAWEALLLLLEVCRILEQAPSITERIFGAGMVEQIETKAGAVPPRRQATEVQRAWVWLPGEERVRVIEIEEGVIRVGGKGPRLIEGAESEAQRGSSCL